MWKLELWTNQQDYFQCLEIGLLAQERAYCTFGRAKCVML